MFPGDDLSSETGYGIDTYFLEDSPVSSLRHLLRKEQ